MEEYICPKCETVKKTISELFLHLKLKHSGSFYELVYCKQPGCLRSFGDIYTYKKHLNTKHRTIASSNSVDNNFNRNIDFNVQIPNNSSEFEVLENNSTIPSQLNDTDKSSSIISVDEFKASLNESMSTFISKLYSKGNFTLSSIQDIIEITKELFNSPFIETLKNTSNQKNHHENLIEMLNVLSHPFENLDTEYMREKYLNDTGYLIKPIAFFVGSETCNKKIDGIMTIQIKDLTAQMIPLRVILKKFLELPNVLNSIEIYINDCYKKKNITSFLNGELWKKIQNNFNGKFMMPLMLFFDDLEINNPLGSKKGFDKLGTVYSKLLCIPPQYASRIENIFLVQLHKSYHLRKFGNKSIFVAIVNELKFLEDTGIIVETEHGIKRIYFTLALFGGDNLGIHTIFGLHESFNSTFYCHICRDDRKILQTAVTENVNNLRTKENFKKDLEQLDKGIKSDTIFHDLSTFHLTENSYCDVMHDLLEGVCRYVIPKVLNILVNIDKILTLDQLNNRIKFFDYGSARKHNSIPPITYDALKGGMFICSASEMKLLLENLGFIIGNLVPKNNKAWQLYLGLREIHCLLLKTDINENSIQLLSSLIEQHNRLYRKLLNESLACKFHFLVHYPSVIRKIGPIYAVSGIRFEGRHKWFKDLAHACRSRKNICYTLSIRNQLNFAERLQSKKGFEDHIQFNKFVETNITEMPDYENFKNVLSENELIDHKYVIPTIEINGTMYKRDFILRTGEQNGLLQFGRIHLTLMNNKREVIFVLNLLNTKYFDKHVHGYVVENTDNWSIVNYQNLFYYKSYNLHNLRSDEIHVPC